MPFSSKTWHMALRGHLGEFGIIAPEGRHRVVGLINPLQDAGDADARRMPSLGASFTAKPP